MHVPGGRSALVLGSIAACLAAAMLAPSGAKPADADALAGIGGPGASELIVQPVDLDRTIPDAVADFRRQGATGGPESVRMSLAGLGLPRHIALDQQPELALGAYSAIVSARSAVAAIARTTWPDSGGSVIDNQSEPSTDVLAPIVVKGFGPRQETSIVAVQNVALDVFLTASVAVNPCRTCLTLRNASVPFHPTFNSLTFSASCR